MIITDISFNLSAAIATTVNVIIAGFNIYALRKKDKKTEYQRDEAAQASIEVARTSSHTELVGDLLERLKYVEADRTECEAQVHKLGRDIIAQRGEIIDIAFLNKRLTQDNINAENEVRRLTNLVEDLKIDIRKLTANNDKTT